MNSEERNIDISVVVPVYNVPEQYLIRCLDSLHTQQFKSVEFIIVNDGSTRAGCESIPKSFQAKDSRFTYILQDNKGVSSARNTGINKANGTYLMFVDGDDFLSPGAIDYVMSLINKHSADAYILGFSVYKGGDVEDIRKKNIFHTVNSKTEKEKLLLDIIGFETKQYTRYNLNVDSPWSKVFLLSKIKERYIKFEESLKRSEDALFCAYYFENCTTILIDNEPIYNYTFNEESVCRKSSDIVVNMLPVICEHFSEYVKLYHNGDIRYWNAISKLAEHYFLISEETYFFHKDTKMSRQLVKQYYGLSNNPIIKKFLLNKYLRNFPNYSIRLHYMTMFAPLCFPYLFYKRYC